MQVPGESNVSSKTAHFEAMAAQSTESIGKEGKSIAEESTQQGSINGRGVTQGAASSGTRRSVRVAVKQLESLATKPTRPAPAPPLPGRVTIKVPARLKNNTTVFVNGKQVFGKPSRPPPSPPSHSESSPSAAKHPPGGVGASFDKLPPDEQKMGKALYDAKMKNDGSFQKLLGKMDRPQQQKAMRALNRFQNEMQTSPVSEQELKSLANTLKEIDRADKGKAEADEAAVIDNRPAETSVPEESRPVSATTGEPTKGSHKLGPAFDEFKQTERDFNSSMKELRDGLSGDPKLAEAFKDEIASLDQLVKASEELLAAADNVKDASGFKQLSESKEFSNVMDSIKDLTLRFDEMGEKGKKPELKDSIANLKFSSKNNFDGMISQPMQRSMRYGLLANAVVEKTKNPDLKPDLKKAEENMKAAAQSVNEAKGRYDDAKAAHSALKEVTTALEGLGKGKRIAVADGKLVVKKKGFRSKTRAPIKLGGAQKIMKLLETVKKGGGSLNQQLLDLTLNKSMQSLIDKNPSLKETFNKLIEDPEHLPPPSEQVTELCDLVSTLTKKGVENNEENMSQLEGLISSIEKTVEELSVDNMSEKELFSLDNYTLMSEVRLIDEALKDIKWAKGEIKEHSRFENLKARADELRARLPDSAVPITVIQMKANLFKMAIFYNRSNDLYQSMADINFGANTVFDLGSNAVGDKVTATFDEFKDTLQYKAGVAKQNLEKNIPQYLNSLAKGNEREKSSLLSSAKTRGLTEGVGSEAEGLLTYASAFLDNIAGNPEGKDELQAEITAINQEVKAAKKAGRDVDPWSIQSDGNVDLIAFQERLQNFINGIA